MGMSFEYNTFNSARSMASGAPNDPRDTAPAARNHVKTLRILREAVKQYGIDIDRIAASARGVRRYLLTLSQYHKQSSGIGGLPVTIRDLKPCLADFSSPAGSLDAEYFYQDWWVAQKIFTRRPRKHLDIGSRIDGLVSHVLVFCPVDFVDVRPISLDIPNFTGIVADARCLYQFPARSVESISCLHVIEHAGLGRYGDAVDPLGHVLLAGEICRLLAPGGYAYISTPIGRERVEFNNQRVFAPGSVIQLFGQLELAQFSAIDDDGHFHESADPMDFASARDACGIFVLHRSG